MPHPGRSARNGEFRTDAKISDAVCWNEHGEMPSVWRNQIHHLFLRLSLDDADGDFQLADATGQDIDGRKLVLVALRKREDAVNQQRVGATTRFEGLGLDQKIIPEQDPSPEPLDRMLVPGLELREELVGLSLDHNRR